MIDISGFIDHTQLAPTATLYDFKTLCEQAVKFGFYSVCVPPYMVPGCKKALEKTNVKVCTVVGFPLGYTSYRVKLIEARQAVLTGADEIDAVINISALKSKDFDYVDKEISLLRNSVKDKILKIIVEAAYLSENEKVKIAQIVMNNGVDFLKTSTGFAPSGAKIEDIKLFHSVLKNSVRLKASGGISSYEQAVAFIKAGASRLGTSKSLKIINNEENDN